MSQKLSPTWPVVALTPSTVVRADPGTNASALTAPVLLAHEAVVSAVPPSAGGATVPLFAATEPIAVPDAVGAPDPEQATRTIDSRTATSPMTPGCLLRPRLRRCG